MKLSKVIPARRETVTFLWIKADFLRIDAKYRATRAKMGTPMDKCFWCGHAFVDGEMMGLAAIRGKRNKVLCQNCVAEAAKKETGG